MRIFLDNASSTQLRCALDALEQARVPFTSAATVTESGRVYGIVVLCAAQAESAENVLRRTGFTTRRG
jgi:hypothetical protein